MVQEAGVPLLTVPSEDKVLAALVHMEVEAVVDMQIPEIPQAKLETLVPMVVLVEHTEVAEVAEVALYLVALLEVMQAEMEGRVEYMEEMEVSVVPEVLMWHHHFLEKME